MLLVYALTRATSDGWGSATTLLLLVGSAALILAFIAIELRSRSPLLPMRIFRLRPLAVANVTMLLVGAIVFSEFFLLTLYLQEVLQFSAVQTGTAFAAFAVTVVIVSNLAQLIIARIGVRRTLDAGLLLMAASLGLARPGCPSTASTSGICSRRSSSAARASGCRSCRSRSRASPASSAPTQASPPG